jgi:TonB family protein
VLLLKTLTAAALLVPALSGAQDTKIALVSPAVLHALAESTPLPEYPILSRKTKRMGVAVIEVVVSPIGKVAKAEILEAPDRSIGSAVDTAVRLWTFHPFLAGGTPLAMKGRLVFYFRLVGGKPIVIDAVAENPASRERAKPIHTLMPKGNH